MFLRNYWYAAALAPDVGRTPIQRRVLNEPLLLYRKEDGAPVALSDICPHRSMPLSKGDRVGDHIRCRYHGLVFDPTGRCVQIPAQDRIPAGVRLATYPVAERWRLIWVWMGDPARADVGDIPDFHWNDDPGWHYVGGHLTIRCGWQLLIDNLMDLSHLTFVHRSTIGNDAVAETPARAGIDGDAIVVERFMDDCPAPPLYVKVRGYTGRIDRMHRAFFRPPANIVIESRSQPSGANDPANGLEYRVLNAITPETETSVHHFWSVPRNFAPGEEVSRMMHEGSLRAFSEDVVVLEEQQRMMESAADRILWTNLDADKGAIHARRLVAKLLKAEQGAARRRAAVRR
jgi:vanillate O-demethylase monooxygenase subunit